MVEEGIAHARERYRPSRDTPTPKIAFARWTEHIESLPELVASRELAGLPDKELSALAQEFAKAPRRKRTDVFRFSFAAAAILATTGAGFAYADFMDPARAVGLSPLAAAAGACFGAAFVAFGAGIWTGFRLVPTESAYAKLGLLVGALDEQHPWLYKAYFAMRDAAALAYRDKVLRERGCIRGMDYLLMREIAELHENMELTQNARTVAASVQGASEVLAPATTHVTPPVVQLAPAAPVAAAPPQSAATAKVLTLGPSSEAA